MRSLHIMNTRDVKEITRLLDSQWGYSRKPDYAFMMNRKGRIYAANREFAAVLDKGLRIDNVGFYFGELKNAELRLSIEGCQIIGPDAKKNVVVLSDAEVEEWVRGLDLEKECGENVFVILKHGGDFVGCGKHSNGKIFNFIPKNRRLKEINPTV